MVRARVPTGTVRGPRGPIASCTVAGNGADGSWLPDEGLTRTTTRALERIVEAYLDRLDAALDGIPERRRRELVADVANRIDISRMDLPIESEAGVRAVLARMGAPEAVAAEELAFHPWSGRRSRLRRGAAAVVALSLVAFGSATAVAYSRGRTPSRATTTVPDVIGRPEGAAEAAIQGAHLRVGQVERLPDNRVATGTVFAIRPGGGSSVHVGAEVTIEVSAGS